MLVVIMVLIIFVIMIKMVVNVGMLLICVFDFIVRGVVIDLVNMVICIVCGVFSVNKVSYVVKGVSMLLKVIFVINC